MNILSSLDYNKKNREEIYWVIYQLLDIIYKYYNHQKAINGDLKNNRRPTMNYQHDEDQDEEEDESMEMVMTQSKSRYAELKPPPRNKDKKASSLSKRRGSKKSKSKSKRGAFSTLENVSSSSDYDSQR